MARPHRHRRPRPAPRAPRFLPSIAMAALLAAGGGAGALAASSTGAGPSLSVSYETVTSWGTGYTGQYTTTNDGGDATTGWTLGFRLPAGTSITSLWNGAHTVSSGQVTVTNAGWDGAIQPGGAADGGFVTSGSGSPAGVPADCTIDGAPCQPGPGSTPSGPPAPSQPGPTPTPGPRPPPGPATPPPGPPAPGQPGPTPSAGPSPAPSPTVTASPTPSPAPSTPPSPA